MVGRWKRKVCVNESDSVPSGFASLLFVCQTLCNQIITEVFLFFYYLGHCLRSILVFAICCDFIWGFFGMKTQCNVLLWNC